MWAAGTPFLAAGGVFAFIMAAWRLPIPRGGALLGSLRYGLFVILVGVYIGAFAPSPRRPVTDPAP